MATRTPLFRVNSNDSSMDEEAQKAARRKNVARYISFASATLSCLCAGSITAFSLYGHLFQSRLRYSQLQVNGCSIAAEISMYLMIPVFGSVSDRVGPAPLSLVSALLFGSGYILAAFTYRSGYSPGDVVLLDAHKGWPYFIMVIAFIAIGVGTTGAYIGGLTAVAKNFGKGRFRGLALATPITAFGLSSMWESQVGSRILYERLPDGSKGDVDVFRYFMFLGVLLFIVGLIGTWGLKIVDEEELIDDAMEEMERSGLLDDNNEFFRRVAEERGYGSIEHVPDDDVASLRRAADRAREQEELEARKKNWLLNEETRLFLRDHTMWWLAAGFFLVTGPAEAFINNLGTIIGTLYTPGEATSGPHTSAATHVSVFAITSTAARIFVGTMTDLLAPVPTTPYHRSSPGNSLSSLPPRPSRFSISRIAFLLFFALLLSLGLVLLASGLIQGHAERFWSVSALVGLGYGAVFSLTPIAVSVIWGVESFGFNWGVISMVPAVGATVYGLLYSVVYQWAAERASYRNDELMEEPKNDVLCYGKECYEGSFWFMAVSLWVGCGMWLWAWRGKDGWKARGIAV